MTPVVAVIAPGAMGAAVGLRLVEHGVKVLTSLEGRSQATRSRAKATGMTATGDEEIAAADYILSILPPGDALALARRFVPVLQARNAKSVYVDCNAINPQTVREVAAALKPADCPFVDAGIIGQPPKTGDAGPRFYASGPAAPRFAALRDYGLDIRVLDGELSAASALKMSYAGITKGLTALGAAMMLGATRAGVAEALYGELAASQPALLAWFTRQIPGMYQKAYRWVAEMEEIAEFLEDDPAAEDMFRGAADLYERLAGEGSGATPETAALSRFLAQSQARKAS